MLSGREVGAECIPGQTEGLPFQGVSEAQQQEQGSVEESGQSGAGGNWVKRLSFQEKS